MTRAIFEGKCKDKLIVRRMRSSFCAENFFAVKEELANNTGVFDKSSDEE